MNEWIFWSYRIGFSYIIRVYVYYMYIYVQKEKNVYEDFRLLFFNNISSCMYLHISKNKKVLRKFQILGCTNEVSKYTRITLVLFNVYMQKFHRIVTFSSIFFFFFSGWRVSLLVTQMPYCKIPPRYNSFYGLKRINFLLISKIFSYTTRLCRYDSRTPVRLI